MADEIQIIRSSITGELYKVVDGATVPDGVFVKDLSALGIAGVTRGELLVNDVLTARQANIFANGTDQTAALNLALALPLISELRIYNPGGGEFTITGTVTATGKRLSFVNGSMLKTTGSGVVNGGIMDAAEDQQIYSGTQNINAEGYARGFVSVAHYGAFPSGTDCSAAIQKAANAIIYDNKMCRRLRFPKAKTFSFSDYIHSYTVSSPIILAKKSSGVAGTTGTFQPFTIRLEADGGHGVNDKTRVQLYCTHANTFGIGIQLGYGVEIDGLSVAGQFNPTFASAIAFYATRPENFVAASSVVCRDTRFSPYAGIVVDPFSTVGAVTADGGYPGLSAWYTFQTDGAQGGSTAGKFTNCHVAGFVTNIILSPNGVTANCEGFYLSKISVEVCKVAFVSCQGQTKGNIISQFQSVDRVNTITDNCTYGGQQGYPFAIHGGYTAGITYRFANIICFQEGIVVSNVFLESIYKIGRITGAAGYGQLRTPSVLTDFVIDYAQGSNATLNAPEFHADLTDVIFRGGSQRNKDGGIISFVGTGIVNDGCRFEHPFMVQSDFGAGGAELPVFTNMAAGNTEDLNFPAATSTSTRQIRKGLHTIQASGYIPYNKLVYNVHDNWARFTLTTASSRPINSTDHTGVLNGVDSNFLNFAQVGDSLLFTYASSTLPTDDGRTYDFVSIVAGTITAVNVGAGTINFKDVPSSVTTGLTTLSSIQVITPLRYGVPFIGDTTNGSATITNVEGMNGVFPVAGHTIRTSSPEERAIRILSVNSGAKTLTVSQVFGYSAVGQSFVNGEPDITIGGAFTNFLLFRGSKVGTQHFLKNLGTVVQSGYFLPSGGQIHQALIANLAGEFKDIFNLGADGTRIITAGEKATEIYLTAYDAATINIGTTPGGTDVLNGVELVSEVSQYWQVYVPATNNVTLYITGVPAASMDVVIVKKYL